MLGSVDPRISTRDNCVVGANCYSGASQTVSLLEAHRGVSQNPDDRTFQEGKTCELRRNRRCSEAEHRKLLRVSTAPTQM